MFDDTVSSCDVQYQGGRHCITSVQHPITIDTAVFTVARRQGPKLCERGRGRLQATKLKHDFSGEVPLLAAGLVINYVVTTNVAWRCPGKLYLVQPCRWLGLVQTKTVWKYGLEFKSWVQILTRACWRDPIKAESLNHDKSTAAIVLAMLNNRYNSEG